MRERPDAFQLLKRSSQASPFLKSSQSGKPLRRRALPAASVRLGEVSERPLFASFPIELLTYTTRVSTLGVNTVQPADEEPCWTFRLTVRDCSTALLAASRHSTVD